MLVQQQVSAQHSGVYCVILPHVGVQVSKLWLCVSTNTCLIVIYLFLIELCNHICSDSFCFEASPTSSPGSDIAKRVRLIVIISIVVPLVFTCLLVACIVGCVLYCATRGNNSNGSELSSVSYQVCTIWSIQSRYWCLFILQQYDEKKPEFRPVPEVCFVTLAWAITTHITSFLQSVPTSTTSPLKTTVERPPAGGYYIPPGQQPAYAAPPTFVPSADKVDF